MCCFCPRIFVGTIFVPPKSLTVFSSLQTMAAMMSGAPPEATRRVSMGRCGFKWMSVGGCWGHGGPLRSIVNGVISYNPTKNGLINDLTVVFFPDQWSLRWYLDGD